LWWLSVDNAFGYLANGQVNLNYLRKSNCYHAYQSLYALNFLTAINLNNNFSLSDYTPKVENLNQNATKNAISINAGNKVIFDIENIQHNIKKFCNCEVYLLKDMTRDEIYEALDKSKIYIDLAHFPGKDRMPREALLRNCCVIVANAGAGYGPDFDLPSELHFDINQLDTLPHVTSNIFENYNFYLELCKNSANKVKRERLIFSLEVSALMKTISLK
jgi:hypothetical protein